MTENIAKGTITNLGCIIHPLHYTPISDRGAHTASSHIDADLREHRLYNPARHMRCSLPSI